MLPILLSLFLSAPDFSKVPFEPLTTRDQLGRTITYYLSRVAKDRKEKRPVVLWIQGSGCQSLFRLQEKVIAGGYQTLLLREAQDRLRIVAVEKPGVRPLDEAQRPGSAIGASEEFLREHTLPRWAEANMAALRAVWQRPEVDASRTLVIGHSEGGLVAAKVAAELPAITHVASLAGSGPTQLFSLAEWQAQPRPTEEPGAAARRRQAVYEEWDKITKDPDSIQKFWLGHPYRRWSSFLRHSTTAELLRSKARIYLAHGTADPSSPVVAFDVLYAELLVAGRDVTAERIDGADHGFRPRDAKPGLPVEMQALFRRILDWFCREG